MCSKAQRFARSDTERPFKARKRRVLHSVCASGASTDPILRPARFRPSPRARAGGRPGRDAVRCVVLTRRSGRSAKEVNSYKGRTIDPKKNLRAVTNAALQRLVASFVTVVNAALELLSYSVFANLLQLNASPAQPRLLIWLKTRSCVCLSVRPSVPRSVTTLRDPSFLPPNM